VSKRNGPDRLRQPAPAKAEGLVRKGLGHTTVASAAASEMRRRILDGTYAAGLPLRQDALAEEFGISRIPVREALLQLEAEGLVRILPHRGAVVSELSAEEVEEIFELRAVLEPRLLKHSAPLLTEADFSALRAILSEFEMALRAGSIERWGELNTAFHILLYQRAARPRTLGLVSTLLRDSDRHTRLQLSYTDGRARAEHEHAELLNLCEARKVREACGLLRSHIENVGRTLMSFLADRYRP
jgi:DNA-binding GntR family transcriptional regulator